MARNFSALVLMVVAAAALIEGTAAAVYIVGDTTAWTIPSSATFYANWAASHTFAVGDILVFNFATGAHDVATVTKTAYDSCSTANPISLQSTPPVNVTLSTSGEHYFICTVGQHCANGQKLSVNVSAAAGSPTPTPSPSPATPTPSPTPSPSSPTPSTTPAPTPAPTPSPPTTSPSPVPSPSSTISPPSPTTPSPSGSTTPSPSGSTSPPPSGSTSPPPPPPSSAPKAVAAFSMVVMSIAIGALF